MTAASINSCSRLRRALRWLAAGAAGVALAMPALAHKASDSYLLLEAAQDQRATLRVDIALRDLDAALDIDTDGDAKLTWAEVRAAFPAIEAYALQRVDVVGCVAEAGTRALEQRVDGVYAALTLALNCNLTAEPLVRYRVLREIDPTHRGLMRVQLPGQRPILRVLDPTSIVAETAAHPAIVQIEAGVGAAQLPQAAIGLQRTAESPAEGVATSPTERTTQSTTDSPDHSTAQSAQASPGFVNEGVHHIVTGWDHVLFLLCLLLPAVMRRTPEGWRPVERLGHAVWPVAGIVTSFTVAHSITLTLAALKIVSLSPSFIEPAIAATIVLAALDNVRPVFFGHRGWVTFAFGLIHGFGFAGVLAELQLPAAQFAWALFQFNMGLELGQLAIVVLATTLLFVVRGQRRYPALAIRGGSFAAIAIGVLWLIERIADVSLVPL